MNYKKISLGALAYFASSFVVQGILGFMFAGDYFLSIPILRIPPIAYLALPQTLLAGIAFASLYPHTNFKGTSIQAGIKFGLLIGLIMVPFVALDLPARFTIPSVGTWIFIQSILGILHFTTSGILVGLIYRKTTKE